jgi:hypothetical protein
VPSSLGRRGSDARRHADSVRAERRQWVKQTFVTLCSSAGPETLLVLCHEKSIIFRATQAGLPLLDNWIGAGLIANAQAVVGPGHRRSGGFDRANNAVPPPTPAKPAACGIREKAPDQGPMITIEVPNFLLDPRKGREEALCVHAVVDAGEGAVRARQCSCSPSRLRCSRVSPA